MLGKEFFIEAHFQTPVWLHEVLEGVSDWEDFEQQSDKVKEYQKRTCDAKPPACDIETKDGKRILVTL